MNEPMKCRCGADARFRYKKPYAWFECKKKCGMTSGYVVNRCPDEALMEEIVKQVAVTLWNKTISEQLL